VLRVGETQVKTTKLL